MRIWWSVAKKFLSKSTKKRQIFVWSWKTQNTGLKFQRSCATLDSVISIVILKELMLKSCKNHKEYHTHMMVCLVFWIFRTSGKRFRFLMTGRATTILMLLVLAVDILRRANV
ncbi:MAG: hypothetical protein RIS24_2532 [Verrucomicrobiota bacterium]